MITRPSCLAAAVLALSALVLPAAQAATASTTLTGVYIQVVDLNTLDGIAPELRLDDSRANVNGHATTLPGTHDQWAPTGLGVPGTNIMLTPNTLVVIQAQAEVSGVAGQNEIAHAPAYLRLSDNAGNTASGKAFKSISTDGTISQGAANPVAANVSFANLGNSALRGFAGVYAEASAQGVAAAPEPGTYGLMSAGLLALGQLSRRRLPR